jgi:HdeA/HdeB family protein
MRHGIALAAGTLFLAMMWLATPAVADGLACDAFQKNPDGSWVAMRGTTVPGAGRVYSIREGSVFRPGSVFLGINLAEQLDAACPAESIAATAPPQVELPKLAGPSGIIDAEKLTCGQLASTYQEDADFLLVWYSGLHSGLSQQHQIDVQKVKAGIHNVIVYCKANHDKPLVQAIDMIMR